MTEAASLSLQIAEMATFFGAAIAFAAMIGTVDPASKRAMAALLGIDGLAFTVVVCIGLYFGHRKW